MNCGGIQNGLFFYHLLLIMVIQILSCIDFQKYLHPYLLNQIRVGLKSSNVIFSPTNLLALFLCLIHVSCVFQSWRLKSQIMQVFWHLFSIVRNYKSQIHNILELFWKKVFWKRRKFFLSFLLLKFLLVCCNSCASYRDFLLIIQSEQISCKIGNL